MESLRLLNGECSYKIVHHVLQQATRKPKPTQELIYLEYLVTVHPLHRRTKNDTTTSNLYYARNHFFTKHSATNQLDLTFFYHMFI